MGNTVSQQVNPAHVRIYVNILSIQNVKTRAEMIQTVLAGPEYIYTAKQTGVYSHLLNYLARVNSGNQPSLLPYEKEPVKQNSISSLVIPPPPPQRDYLSKPKNEEKAIGYFQACLEVLGLQEEVALTDELLKSSYKKAALRNHPDKGGSEKAFERVTRAYAYLSEILKRIHGGRKETVNVDAPNVLKDSRSKDSNQWKQVEPVRLNPKKLDIDAFNKMFEQTRIPDPEEDGYGDWLRDEKEGSKAATFSGKFNRDVFNQAFEEEAKKNGANSNFIVTQPESLMMAPNLGIEIGRGKPSSYTAPIMNKNMNFTDLKQAYTIESNISQQVASVRVDNRNFESYKDERSKAPRPLNSSEMEDIQKGERLMAKKEEERRRRAAEEDISSTSYFERMKRLVLMDVSKDK
jgi:curved DNA-binding protein CbpA